MHSFASCFHIYYITQSSFLFINYSLIQNLKFLMVMYDFPLDLPCFRVTWKQTLR